MTPSPRAVSTFPHRTIGATVHVYDSVPSTNDLAAAFGDDPAFAGVAVTADEQTAGRGQYGRVWRSRAGSSLLMSVVVPTRDTRPALLTAWAACSIAAVVERCCGKRPRLKWPNDLLVDERKICGILIEQSRSVVLGMGLNVDQVEAEFRDALLPDATSLRMLRGADADRLRIDAVRELVIDALDSSFLRMGELEAEWRELVGLEGRTVSLDLQDGTTRIGRLRSLAFAGLELDEGSMVPVVYAPESIRGLRR